MITIVPLLQPSALKKALKAQDKAAEALAKKEAALAKQKSAENQ